MSARQVEFHPDAVREAEEARRWYAERDDNAGVRFVLALERAVGALAKTAEAGSPHMLGTRRILIRRFPFMLVYRINADVVRVLAVAHQRRLPAYWRSR